MDKSDRILDHLQLTYVPTFGGPPSSRERRRKLLRKRGPTRRYIHVGCSHATKLMRPASGTALLTLELPDHRMLNTQLCSTQALAHILLENYASHTRHYFPLFRPMWISDGFTSNDDLDAERNRLRVG